MLGGDPRASSALAALDALLAERCDTDRAWRREVARASGALLTTLAELDAVDELARVLDAAPTWLGPGEERRSVGEAALAALVCLAATAPAAPRLPAVADAIARLGEPTLASRARAAILRARVIHGGAIDDALAALLDHDDEATDAALLEIGRTAAQIGGASAERGRQLAARLAGHRVGLALSGVDAALDAEAAARAAAHAVDRAAMGADPDVSAIAALLAGFPIVEADPPLPPWALRAALPFDARGLRTHFDAEDAFHEDGAHRALLEQICRPLGGQVTLTERREGATLVLVVERDGHREALEDHDDERDWARLGLIERAAQAALGDALSLFARSTGDQTVDYFLVPPRAVKPLASVAAWRALGARRVTPRRAR